MMGLMVFLCIVCPWIIPCLFIIWILDKLCWKFINWNTTNWMSLPFKTRYWRSWGIMTIVILPWTAILCLLTGETLGVVLIIALLMFIVFIALSTLITFILLIKKWFRKLRESE